MNYTELVIEEFVNQLSDELQSQEFAIDETEWASIVEALRRSKISTLKLELRFCRCNHAEIYHSRSKTAHTKCLECPCKTFESAPTNTAEVCPECQHERLRHMNHEHCGSLGYELICDCKNPFHGTGLKPGGEV